MSRYQPSYQHEAVCTARLQEGGHIQIITAVPQGHYDPSSNKTAEHLSGLWSTHTVMQKQGLIQIEPR